MLSLSPSSSFADRLRSAALAGGYETLIDTLGRLVGAVPMAAQQGLWETTVGPFPGAWHTDAGEGNEFWALCGHRANGRALTATRVSNAQHGGACGCAGVGCTTSGAPT